MKNETFYSTLYKQVANSLYGTKALNQPSVIKISDSLDPWGRGGVCREIVISEQSEEKFRKKYDFGGQATKDGRIISPFAFYDLSFFKKIIFNGPATIIFWSDGSKTVVKVSDGDVFDPEMGICLATIKKFYPRFARFGHNYYKHIKYICDGRYDTTNLNIKAVHFNDPLSVMIFDHRMRLSLQEPTEYKVFVKCGSDEDFNKEKAVCMMICKRLFGNAFYRKVVKPNVYAYYLHLSKIVKVVKSIDHTVIPVAEMIKALFNNKLTYDSDKGSVSVTNYNENTNSPLTLTKRQKNEDK